MFLKYLAKMDLILILSKFSGQIGPKPKRFVFHSQFNRSDRSGRVNGKRPKTGSFKRISMFSHNRTVQPFD